MKPAIEINDLSFSFNGQEVLKNVSLTVQEGDFLALIGPNGGGKTTLLKLILGLLRPRQGTVRVFGRRPGQVLQRIGYVPQDVHLNRSFPATAFDVVLMGRLRSARGWPRRSAADRMAALSALEKLDLKDCVDRPISRLSGGQRQRVLIARALVSDPQLLLLDEPTTGIDTQGQTEFYSLLKDFNKTATILMVSHDLMTLSGFVKSVACVNRFVHHHNEAEITGEMLSMYQCPVELVAHGLPHRVLRNHG